MTKHRPSKPWSNTVDGQKAMFYGMERDAYEELTRPLLPISVQDHIAQVVGKWPRMPIHLPAGPVPVDSPLEDAAVAVAAYYSTQVMPDSHPMDILRIARMCIQDAAAHQH